MNVGPTVGMKSGGNAGSKSVRRREPSTKSVRSPPPQRIAAHREAAGAETSSPRPHRPPGAHVLSTAAQRKGQKLASDMMISTFGALAVVQLAVNPLSVPCEALARPSALPQETSSKRDTTKRQQPSASGGLKYSAESGAEISKRAAQYPAWDSKTNPLAMTATPGTRPPDFAYCRGRLPLAERCNAS